ncbi:MAG: tryptophan synthase subunit alpha [Marinifilaceae bacterium]
MNRINTLFQQNKNNILSIYFCAGHPNPDNVVETIQTLQDKGINMIEIGIPFSDPMADGPVIQKAATKAIKDGMTLKKLFQQLKEVRTTVHIPLLLMGYLNPIMRYGFEAFCSSCREVGIDGIIIPDLPFNEYVAQYKSIADAYGIHIIMLITPETSPERINLIDRNTNSFIYMVSSASTTGAQQAFSPDTLAYFKRINDMNLRSPRMIGFGISNANTLQSAYQYAAGAIIGSKYVGLLDKANNCAKATEMLLEAIS